MCLYAYVCIYTSVYIHILFCSGLPCPQLCCYISLFFCQCIVITITINPGACTCFRIILYMRTPAYKNQCILVLICVYIYLLPCIYTYTRLISFSGPDHSDFCIAETGSPPSHPLPLFPSPWLPSRIVRPEDGCARCIRSGGAYCLAGTHSMHRLTTVLSFCDLFFVYICIYLYIHIWVYIYMYTYTVIYVYRRPSSIQLYSPRFSSIGKPDTGMSCIFAPSSHVQLYCVVPGNI